MDINDKCYGSFGWRQFWENRIEILKDYDRQKGLNLNNPVRTSHGVALEAKIRDWLTTFLPKKYGVTSGYIIPDIVVSNYSLKHFDIIIYNQLESPILWIEENDDDSHLGAKKAIPAKYVSSVIEVKATLNKKSILDSISKLSELKDLKEYLPSNFCCTSIFAEIGKDVQNNLSILENFLDCCHLIGYYGSLILRSNTDESSSGIVEIQPSTEADNLYPNVQLTKSIDELNIFKDEKGQIVLNHQHAGLLLYFTSTNAFSVSKLYFPHIIKNHFEVSVIWSRNSFTRFFIKTLNALEGLEVSKDKFNFGQVFDKID